MTRASLYQKHHRLANAIAREFYLPGADRDDVHQEARLALWNATASWDRSKGASFRTYARLVIRRHLATQVKSANRKKHRALTDAVRDEQLQLIPDSDLERTVLARDRLRRALLAMGTLTRREREGFTAALNGEPQDKTTSNAAERARVKLRAA